MRRFSFLLAIYLTIRCHAQPYTSTHTSIQLGIKNPQTFTAVLIDTTNTQTWVFGPNANAPSPQQKWSGGVPSGGTAALQYSLFNTTVPGKFGYRLNLSTSGAPAIPISFGLSTNTKPLYFWGINQTIQLSGSLSLDRQSQYVKALPSFKINEFSLSGGVLTFAPFTGGNYAISKAPVLTATSSLWAVNGALSLIAHKQVPFSASGQVAVVIDSANPNITFEVLPIWQTLGGLFTLNPDINLTVANVSHIISHKSYKQSQIDVRVVSTTSVPGMRMVIRLGYPFLLNRLVKMDVTKQEVWIATPLPPPPPAKPKAQWTTIIIIGVVVLFVAIAFFLGAHYYCRLPPETARQPTEEQPFLGGQAARHGQYSRIENEPPSAPSMQQPPSMASQPSAPSSQPAQPPAATSARGSASGQVLGGTGARDAASMRNQRLAALERNMQAETEE